MFNFKQTSILVSMLIALSSSQIVTVVPTCTPTATLTTFGLSNNAATVSTNGTCKNYFASNGGCTPVDQISILINDKTNWLKTQALNANNFALQFINATVYFQTQQGFISTSTSVSTSSLSSFFSSITSIMSSLANRATGLFNNSWDWMKTLFNDTVSKVNPCFQAWANLTAGSYCILASSNNVTTLPGLMTSAQPVVYYADPVSTGNALISCLPLINNYCSLTYGVSISNSASPFNTTFNLNDGGLTMADCYAFRNTTNCTTTACISNQQQLLTNIFKTNWIKFVPSDSSITNLGNFFAGTANITSYVAVQQTSNGIGIALGVGSLINVFGGENVYADGLVSGQPNTIYGSIGSLTFSFIFALLAFLI